MGLSFGCSGRNTISLKNPFPVANTVVPSDQDPASPPLAPATPESPLPFSSPPIISSDLANTSWIQADAVLGQQAMGFEFDNNRKVKLVVNCVGSTTSNSDPISM